MKKKTVLKTCVGVFVILLILLLAAGYLLVDFSLVPSSAAGKKYRGGSSEKPAAPMPLKDRMEHDAALWNEKTPHHDVSIVSDDGITLSGTEYDQERTVPGQKWVILVHGYRGDRNDMLVYARQYFDWGYSVITPDNRAHGKSGGKKIGMGWNDRLDVICWIKEISTRHPDARIVLHGVSMGAATVMMTAGEKLPQTVAAVVEDCGYTSVRDEFAYELNHLFHLPSFVFLPPASVIAKIRMGFFFGEASSLRQLQKTKLPVLFIHGGDDTFVPTEMVYRNYAVAPGRKNILVVAGARHARSVYQNPVLYWKTTAEFLQENVR
jgi:uncharacterized protein